MASSSYSVSIGSITKSAPSDGFVDPFKIEFYMAKTSPTAPTSFDTTKTKERANMRWKLICSMLDTVGNMYPRDIVAAAGDTNSAPSSVTFTLLVEHGEAGLVTADENNAGTKLLGVAAIKRVIARAMMRESSGNQEVYDPTLTTTSNDSTPKVRFGNRILPITAGALAASIAEAEAVITVTAL